MSLELAEISKSDESASDDATADGVAISATPPQVGKQARHWLATKAAIEMIDKIKQVHELDEVYYKLGKDTPKQFAGTYVSTSICTNTFWVG
jgi:hypothetical protein